MECVPLNYLTPLLALLLLASGCTRPAEVYVTLDGQGWWLQQVSYRGCSWAGLLEAAQSTTIGNCVPGVGPVSFQARPAPDVEPGSELSSDTGDLTEGPLDWRWYRTQESFRVRAGEVQELVVVTDGWMELP